MAVHAMPTPARQPEPEPEVELTRGALRPDRAPVISEPESDLNRTYRPEQLAGSDDDAMIVARATSHDLHAIWAHLAERTRQIAADERLSLPAKIGDSQVLAAEQLVRANSKALKVLGQLEKRRAKLQAELATPPKSVDQAQAAELRGVLRQMRPAQRSERVRQAIASGDVLLVAAVYSAHPLASGFGGEMRELLAADAARLLHPDQARTLDQVEKALEHVSRLRDSWHRRSRETFAVRLAPRRQPHEALAPDMSSLPEEAEEPPAA